MKYQFDLLPEEYKSSPRDNIGLFLAIVLLIIAAVSIGWNVSQNKATFKGIDTKIKTANNQLEAKYAEIKSNNPDTQKILEVKKKIEFINKNLDTPGTDAVAFLTSFEACVPDGIIIRDLTPKKLSNLNVPFIVNGEASTIQDILEFTNRLQNSDKFRAYLKSNNSAVVSDRIIQNFVLEFTYKKQ